MDYIDGEVPSVDLEEPGLAIRIEKEVVSVELIRVVAMGDQFLHCFECFDNASLNIRKSIICLLYSKSI